MSLNDDNFDDIKSYDDSEVNGAIHRLLDNDYFRNILLKIYPESQVPKIIDDLKTIHSVHDFQNKYIHDLARNIINTTIRNLSVSGISNLKRGESYLFISTHRDIVLDSALLNETLHDEGFKTSEIAIGGNLLIYPWIEIIVRLNRSFIVKRKLQGREILIASKKLATYIRKKIVNDQTSVWIAQKEGRTKDGNDKTQIALLKMLNMSGESDLVSNFKELKIVPLTISYEYETCIVHKVKEVYAKRNNIPFEKTKEDDLKSMGQGLFGKKGNVHICFGKPMDAEIDQISTLQMPAERFEKLGAVLDQEMYKGYKFFAGNYLAHDLHTGDNAYFMQGKYTKNQLDKFLEVANRKIEKLEGNRNELLAIYIEIYAMPLINKLNIK